jgi:predicted TIM-barrel fold metal-dependent hydrolase
MRTLSACSNVAVKIFGMECIFGSRWTVEQIHQWILDTIELLGSDRCIFGSRRPIAKLACNFQKLYGANFDVVSEFTASEKRKLFHDAAITIYGVTKPGRSRESNPI